MSENEKKLRALLKACQERLAAYINEMNETRGFEEELLRGLTSEVEGAEYALRENDRLTAQLAEANQACVVQASMVDVLKAQLSEARAALTSIRDQTYVDAEGPELRAQNEMNHRKASDALDALAPAPPGAVLVTREDAERWQPIETAPKDGSTVLLYCPGGVGVVAAAWLTADIHWWHVDDGKHGPFPVRGPSPTLWMPLPPVPGLPVEGQS